MNFFDGTMFLMFCVTLICIDFELNNVKGHGLFDAAYWEYVEVFMHTDWINI